MKHCICKEAFLNIEFSSFCFLVSRFVSEWLFSFVFLLLKIYCNMCGLKNLKYFLDVSSFFYFIINGFIILINHFFLSLRTLNLINVKKNYKLYLGECLNISATQNEEVSSRNIYIWYFVHYIKYCVIKNCMIIIKQECSKIATLYYFILCSNVIHI